MGKVKEFYYDITELYCKAMEIAKKKHDFKPLGLALKYTKCYQYADRFEWISDTIIDMVIEDAKAVYEIIKNVDVGYDTSLSKKYLYDVANNLD